MLRIVLEQERNVEDDRVSMGVARSVDLLQDPGTNDGMGPGFECLPVSRIREDSIGQSLPVGTALGIQDLGPEALSQELGGLGGGEDLVSQTVGIDDSAVCPSKEPTCMGFAGRNPSEHPDQNRSRTGRVCILAVA